MDLPIGTSYMSKDFVSIDACSWILFKLPLVLNHILFLIFNILESYVFWDVTSRIEKLLECHYDHHCCKSFIMMSIKGAWSQF